MQMHIITIPIAVLIDLKNRARRQLFAAAPDSHAKRRSAREFHLYRDMIREHYHDRRN